MPYKMRVLISFSDRHHPTILAAARVIIFTVGFYLPEPIMQLLDDMAHTSCFINRTRRVASMEPVMGSSELS